MGQSNADDIEEGIENIDENDFGTSEFPATNNINSNIRISDLKYNRMPK